MVPQRRAQGAFVALVEDDPHQGEPCTCDWSKPGGTAEDLRHRVLPTPDQSRYGLATSDPLGRNAPEWRIGRHGLPVRETEEEPDDN